MNLFLLAVVFLTPLLEAGYGFGYEQIKVLFFILSNSLIGFIWLFSRPKLRWNLIRITSAVFILTLFVVSALSTDSKISFLGREPYFQGWLLYAYLFPNRTYALDDVNFAVLTTKNISHWEFVPVLSTAQKTLI